MTGQLTHFVQQIEIVKNCMDERHKGSHGRIPPCKSVVSYELGGRPRKLCVNGLRKNFWGLGIVIKQIHLN